MNQAITLYLINTCNYIDSLKKGKLGTLAHACIPRNQGAEAGGLRVEGQPEVQETLPQK